MRADGLEIVFTSNRSGGLGGGDFWVSTRGSVNAPWSIPVNVGPPVNTASGEIGPSLSPDGRTLLFAALKDRGGIGYGTDLWMATRTPR